MIINHKLIVSALAALFISAGAASAQTIVKADSVRVYFEYNKSEFNPSYKGNGASMDKLVREVRVHDSAPEYIIINSSSSPEGPADGNARLTRRRQESMLQYLSGQVDIKGIPVHKTESATDWERMKRLVFWDVAMPIKYKTQVMEKLNGEDPSSVNELFNSSAWEYLMKNIFPNMRCSEIVFVW